MEQQEKDQRGLEEIVAECREKLGPEQGREAPRHQQRRGHEFSAGSNGRAARNARRILARSARARAMAAGAADLTDDNLGKRTIAAPRDAVRARKVARKKNAGGPGPPAAQVPPCLRANGAELAASRAPSQSLPHLDKRQPHTRA